MSICADLGRCAYAVADEQYGKGSEAEGCPWWANCFGLVPIGDGLSHDGDQGADETIGPENDQ